MTATKERSIILKESDILLIVKMRKVTTRRMCRATEAASLTQIYDHGNGMFGSKDGSSQFKCPYGKIGDRLWLREGWTEEHPLAVQQGRYSQLGQTFIAGPPSVHFTVIYRADGDPLPIWLTADGEYPYFSPERPIGEIAACYPIPPSNYGRARKTFPWRTATCMPRWASRINLQITAIRTERLHDTSLAEAIATGLVSRLGYWKANSWVWVVDLEQVREAA